MNAIKDASLQRLRPILMTSASTILGLIPLAFATSEGCNQRIAMGTAVVGGMLISITDDDVHRPCHIQLYFNEP